MSPDLLTGVFEYILIKMVVIDTKDTHCPAIMEALNNLRKVNSYCDTNIVIGDHKLPAHKNVLIAGSDYFKSCFGGPFKDVTSDIDLSFMTVSVTNVEEALNFLYTGQVDINKENIGGLVENIIVSVNFRAKKVLH